MPQRQSISRRVTMEEEAVVFMGAISWTETDPAGTHGAGGIRRRS
jgi:hypothetical protein